MGKRNNGDNEKVEKEGNEKTGEAEHFDHKLTNFTAARSRRALPVCIEGTASGEPRSPREVRSNDAVESIGNLRDE